MYFVHKSDSKFLYAGRVGSHLLGMYFVNKSDIETSI